MEPEFSSEALCAVIEQAEASATEICGLLLGTAERVEAMTATRNVAQDPARHFEVDPAALFAALRATRRGGPAILGHYHSHPRGSPDPSMTDAAQAAADGRLWLIVGGGTARLWRAVAQGERHGRFDRVRFAVAIGGHVEKSCEAVHMDRAGRTMTFAKA
ncbi:MAG: hypothetical protein DI632_03275 [Sphingomonas hengshuiensis]|uniref:JAB domain-containing protein n=1 Tax=Sphingomonas hengshuiensis TaxID=1609977 RepID=A0A2W4ZIU2_9SPHN|nr:MAG: hypothetical protein DI632_03275 [Sphingomonas hengshuiensis]